jgi:hypothetical protein
MAKIRVYYLVSSGKLIGCEHRLEEDYSRDNQVPWEVADVGSLIVDSSALEVPFTSLVVEEGEIRKVEVGTGARREERLRATDSLRMGSTGESVQQRIEELRRTDKSALSDGQWLSLFREFSSLTGQF